VSHGSPARGEFVETRGRRKIDQLGEQAIPASRREAGRPRSGHVPEASGREAGQRLTSLVSTSVPFRLRQAVNALHSTAMLLPPNLGKTPGRTVGGRNLGRWASFRGPTPNL